MKTGSTTGCYSVSGKARSLAGMACMAAGMLLAAPAGAAFGTNLIVNPGAEAGPGSANGDAVGGGNIPGWSNSAEFTVVAYGPDRGFPDSTSPGPLDRGFNFFAGGPDNPLSSAHQVLDVSFAAAAIDGGWASYSLSGWLGGFGADDDNAVLSASFLDTGSIVLGSASIGPVLALDRGAVRGLLSRETAGLLPAGTRSVALRLTMTRTDGIYNDGYADNLSFSVTAVPEPGQWLLTVSGLALLAVRLRRGLA